MTLLLPLTADEWGDDEYAAVGALFGMPGDDVPRAGSGDPRDPMNFDILGVLARHPAMARKFLTYNAFLLQRGELPLRLRELAVLRLAHARRSVFFWGEHVRVATAGGLSEEDIAGLAAGNDGFDGVDRLVLEATDELLADGSCDTGDVATTRRGPRHAPGDGAHLRRRYVRDAGDGVRHLGPRAATRQRATSRAEDRPMTTSATDELYYDPWHADLNVDPYPMFKRFRDEAPLYYNDEHDFFALSRFDDVNRTLVDHQSFSSARGAVLEIIKSGMEIPPGLLIFEDPPIHDIHRNLLARAFTPRKINALEPMIRDFTQKCLDPLVGGDRFDFVKDLGAVMPLRVVSMLFGIPEDYQHLVQEDGDRHVRTERGGQMTDNPEGTLSDGQVFAEFIDWRVDHPADDLTTELLNAEFTDETGTARKLRRDELLDVHEPRRGRRRGDDHSVDRMDGQAAVRTPRPT